MFLSTGAQGNAKAGYLERVRRLALKSEKLDFAVAFWGKGVSETLLKNSTKQKIRVICNLGMGGTNPSVIEQLVAKKITVRHSDKLHAKVMLFGNFAIVGSANCSANGLGFEGHELSAWFEAGIELTDPAVIRDIETWFEGLWGSSSEVTKSDLEQAKALWKLRRHERSYANIQNLLKALMQTPSQFEDREIYALYIDEGLDKNGEDAQEEVQKERDPNWYVYQDWPELPSNAVFIEFFVSGKSFQFNGFYETQSESDRFERNGCLIIPAKNIDRIGHGEHAITEKFLKPLGDWKRIFERAKTKRNIETWDCLKLSEIVEKKLLP